MQAIAELGDHAEALEFQQRDRIAPFLQLVLIPVAHLGGDPVHLRRQAKLVEHGEERMVRNRMKVVIPFDRQAVEIKRRRHAADTVVGFKQHRRVAVARQLVRDSQAHRPGAEHGDTLPYDDFSHA
jgi:hypothetical protein